MENEHPIESLMRTTLDSIKNMVDVNTILGDPVETPDGKVIVPISRVTFGFAAGGTEYEPAGQEEGGGRSHSGPSSGGSTGQDGGKGQQGQGLREESRLLPFGGGSGAGISIQPVGFLVVGHDEMRLLPVDQQVLYDRLLDLAPRLLEGLQGLTRGRVPGAGAVPAETGTTGQPATGNPLAGAPAPATSPAATMAGKPLIRLRGRNPGPVS